MNLLFVHERLGAFGGAEANLLLTARELRQRGHRVSLLYAQRTGKGEAPWEVFERSDAIPANASPHWLEQWVRTADADVVYLHTLSELPLLEALGRTGVPVVRMIHDHDLYCLRSYKYNFFTRKPCTRAASGCCVFPCLAIVARNRSGWLPIKLQSFSRKQKELEVNRGFSQFIVYSNYSRTELIQNGFDPSRVHISAPIPDLGSTAPVSSFGPRNLIIFAGQIIRGKGVDALLRALGRVHSSFECLIFGEGSHRPYCERLSRKLGLERQVRFMGFASAAEMQKHYLDASLAVVSSLWPEPFGMVGPEAMRYGLPVVAFDAGGIREWLRDGQNGCLVPWNDQEEFARRIDLLLSHKEMARTLGRSGREMVRTEYHPERQLDVVERVLQDQALRKQRGRAAVEQSGAALRSTASVTEAISNP